MTFGELEPGDLLITEKRIWWRINTGIGIELEKWRKNRIENSPVLFVAKSELIPTSQLRMFYFIVEGKNVYLYLRDNSILNKCHVKKI